MRQILQQREEVEQVLLGMCCVIFLAVRTSRKRTAIDVHAYSQVLLPLYHRCLMPCGKVARSDVDGDDLLEKNEKEIFNLM